MLAPDQGGALLFIPFFNLIDLPLVTEAWGQGEKRVDLGLDRSGDRGEQMA